MHKNYMYTVSVSKNITTLIVNNYSKLETISIIFGKLYALSF